MLAFIKTNPKIIDSIKKWKLLVSIFSCKNNINIEPKILRASPQYFKYACCTYNLNLDNTYLDDLYAIILFYFSGCIASCTLAQYPTSSESGHIRPGPSGKVKSGLQPPSKVCIWSGIIPGTA